MTPHNRAKVGEIANTVLMPGDPNRAKFCAENYFDSPRLVTDVRGILGYTGTYKGMPISVMASGMGAASIGIYSYELFTHYDVDSIIRIGTSGGLQDYLKPGDLVLAMTCSTDHSWASQYNLKGTLAPCVDYTLFKTAVECLERGKRDYYCGMVFSSEYFSSYNALGPDEWKSFASMGALVQDMETHALYCNAMYTKKRALSILTMTDNVVTGESFKDEERMEGNRPMIELALETAYADWKKRK